MKPWIWQGNKCLRKKNGSGHGRFSLKFMEIGQSFFLIRDGPRLLVTRKSAPPFWRNPADWECTRISVGRKLVNLSVYLSDLMCSSFTIRKATHFTFCVAQWSRCHDSGQQRSVYIRDGSSQCCGWRNGAMDSMHNQRVPSGSTKILADETASAGTEMIMK